MADLPKHKFYYQDGRFQINHHSFTPFEQRYITKTKNDYTSILEQGELLKTHPDPTGNGFGDIIKKQKDAVCQSIFRLLAPEELQRELGDDVKKKGHNKTLKTLLSLSQQIIDGQIKKFGDKVNDPFEKCFFDVSQEGIRNPYYRRLRAYHLTLNSIINMAEIEFANRDIKVR